MIGRDFLGIASALARDTSEAAWRSAVSRAYYAAFHVARELLESMGFSVPHGDRAHGYLWLRLQNCCDSLTQDAGRDLKMLRGDRNGADYNLHQPSSKVEARRCIDLAQGIIQSLDAARIEPTRTQIRDAMKIYERDVLRDVTWHS